jgi:anthranilate synthase component 1
VIKAFLEDVKIVVVGKKRSGRDVRFAGGFVGYFSYDLVRYFVDVGERTVDDLNQPDCEFLLTKKNIIVDHKEKKAFLISNEVSYDGGIEFESQENENLNLEDFIENCKDKNETDEDFDFDYTSAQAQAQISRDFTSNVEKEDYKRGVRTAKKYIRAGDIFQVVLSQRLESDFEFGGNRARAQDQAHFEFYKKLNLVNPSPYMYFLDFGERKIVGSSPEMLVRVGVSADASHGHRGGRKVEGCPIAGTRRRGRSKEEDKELEEEMMKDEKERAEHLMLVDLARNDIGKVSKFGTVKVTKFMYPEKFSHVQHIVSDVVGELRDEKDEFDALEATFPAGTVSGAPKVRAMEIIEELEPMRRGIYSGCVGYFSFNRSIDMAITIRTAIFEKRKAYLQAGAGIVADSDPEREYKETMSKCAALLECMPKG